MENAIENETREKTAVNSISEPTVEQKRLDAVQEKLSFQLRTLEEQSTKNLSLTHQLLALSPATASKISVDATYKPSISAHSTPSSIPRLSTSDQDIAMAEAKEIIKQHIQRLHSYNEVKDVAQGLMGMIADARGVRVKELYETSEFGVNEND